MKGFRDSRINEFLVMYRGKVIASFENLEEAIKLAEWQAKEREEEIEIVTYLWSVKS